MVEPFVESDGLRAGASVFPRLGGIWVINAYGDGRDVREHEPIQKNTSSESSDSLTEDPHAKWWYDKQHLTPNPYSQHMTRINSLA